MKGELSVLRAILMQLDAAFPASLPPEIIADGLKLAGFEFSARETARRLEYLEQKGMLELLPSRLFPPARRAKITAAGIDYLQGGIF